MRHHYLLQLPDVLCDIVIVILTLEDLNDGNVFSYSFVFLSFLNFIFLSVLTWSLFICQCCVQLIGDLKYYMHIPSYFDFIIVYLVREMIILY